MASITWHDAYERIVAEFSADERDSMFRTTRNRSRYETILAYKRQDPACLGMPE